MYPHRRGSVAPVVQANVQEPRWTQDPQSKPFRCADAGQFPAKNRSFHKTLVSVGHCIHAASHSEHPPVFERPLQLDGADSGRDEFPSACNASAQGQEVNDFHAVHRDRGCRRRGTPFLICGQLGLRRSDPTRQSVPMNLHFHWECLEIPSETLHSVGWSDGRGADEWAGPGRSRRSGCCPTSPRGSGRRRWRRSRRPGS